MKKFTFLLALSFLLSNTILWSQEGNLATEPTTSVDNADELAVHAAILDYVEAIYLVDSTRIERSVHPSLRKIGYWYDKKNAVYHDNLEMTHEELVSLSAEWNANGKRADSDSPKEIVLFEVNDKTAVAKLTAVWGIDYFQLAKTEGKWVIMNVIWQSAPQ